MRSMRAASILVPVVLSVAVLSPGPVEAVRQGRRAPSLVPTRSGVDPAAQAWVARYNGPPTVTTDSDDVAEALGVSPDGSTVFVTGFSAGSTSKDDYATIAYDAATGGERWVARYTGLGNVGFDHAYALGVSPDGFTVYVTGYSSGSNYYYDYATVAYDASTGAQLWFARYNGPGNDADIASALVVSPDGSTVFVSGSSTGSATYYDYATVAYDATTGAKHWVARYNGPGDGYDQVYDLGVRPDGSAVFVTGGSGGSTSYDDYATVAYDASTGSQQWVARYNGPGNFYDSAIALGVSPDGSAVFVTGYGPGSTTLEDYATLAYDAATGAQLWLKRYNGPGNGDDFAFALGVSPDGSTVFVSGPSTGSTSNWDYATVAYDAATGSQRWVARYNSPANGDDAAYSLVVSPDGSAVIVTGSSGGDYATVDYNL